MGRFQLLLLLLIALFKIVDDTYLTRDSHPFGVPEQLHGGEGSQGRRRQEMEDFRRETEEFRRGPEDFRRGTEDFRRETEEFRRGKQEQPKRSPGGSRKFRGNSFSLSPSSNHSRFTLLSSPSSSYSHSRSGYSTSSSSLNIIDDPSSASSLTTLVSPTQVNHWESNTIVNALKSFNYD